MSRNREILLLWKTVQWVIVCCVPEPSVSLSNIWQMPWYTVLSLNRCLVYTLIAGQPCGEFHYPSDVTAKIVAICLHPAPAPHSPSHPTHTQAHTHMQNWRGWKSKEEEDERDQQRVPSLFREMPSSSLRCTCGLGDLHLLNRAVIIMFFC